MSKRTEAVKPFDEFRAPWETADGSEAELDKGKVKRLIHKLTLDGAKALDQIDELQAAVKAVETERDQAKDDAAKASPDEANRKIARLEKENEALKGERDTLSHDLEVTKVRGELLGGLDPKVAKYVKGETKEEIEASLAEVKADFGISDEKDGEDGEDKVRTTPRSNLVNRTDPTPPGRGSGEIDFDKAADEILGYGVFG